MNYRTIISSFVTLAFGEFSSKAFGFLTMIYLARVLGADNFGIIGFVSAVSAYVVLFADFGIEQYASRSLAAGSVKENGRLITTVLGSRFMLSLALIVPFIGFGILYSHNSSESWFFIFQSIFILAYAFNLQFYFVAVKNIAAQTMVRIVAAFCILLCSLLFVKSSSDLPLTAFISGTVTFLVFAAAAGYVVRKEGLELKTFSISGMIPLLKNAAPLGVSALMIQIYYSADIVFLGFTNPGAELGYYSGAYRIILIFTAVPGMLYMIFLPDLARITSRHFQHRSTRAYIGLLVCFGCILTVVSYIWSWEIVTMVLGMSYAPAVGVFNILLLNVFMVFVNVSLGNLLIAWNAHSSYLRVVTSGAAANIVFNIALIPRYGIYGAAVSTVLAECAVCISSLYYNHTMFGLFKKEAQEIS